MASYTWNHIFQKKQNGGNVSTIIADDNTITDPIEIAENFNNFFTSIGTNLPKKIPSTEKTFTDYFKKPNSENFIIAPTTADRAYSRKQSHACNFLQKRQKKEPENILKKGSLTRATIARMKQLEYALPNEISDLIHNLKSSKSVGPYSVPTKIMKISKEIITLRLSQLINDSISKGSFPNICQLAQVIPIFKSDSRLLCTNYRPISLFSNMSKIFEKVIHSRLNFFLEQHVTTFIHTSLVFV